MNKESDNHTAEQLLRLLGAHDRGLGTVENGVQVVRRWLEQRGGDLRRFPQFAEQPACVPGLSPGD